MSIVRLISGVATVYAQPTLMVNVSEFAQLRDENMIAVITKFNFIEWLKSRPTDQMFQAGHPCKCIVAQYFNNAGLSNIAISNTHASYGDWHARSQFPLPNWAWLIVAVMDARFGINMFSAIDVLNLMGVNESANELSAAIR